MTRIVKKISGQYIVESSDANIADIVFGSSLRSDASVVINGNLILSGTSTTFTNAETKAIATFDGNTYHSAKYAVSIVNGTESQLAEIMITANATATQANVTHNVYTDAVAFATFAVTGNVGNTVTLSASGTGAGTSNTAKVQRLYIL